MKKRLEDKLLELKVGYWERMTPDDKYPEKIPGQHDKQLPQFTSVSYAILDKVIGILPPRSVILTMHRNPNQILTMMVDERVTYRYHFAGLRNEHPAFMVVDATEIYSILYEMLCQIDEQQARLDVLERR